MSTALPSPSNLQIVADEQLIIPERPNAVTQSSGGSETSSLITSLVSGPATQRETLIQFLEAVLKLLKELSDTPTASPAPSQLDPQTTGARVQTTNTTSNSQSQRSNWTSDGRLISASPGVFQTKFGTLVTSSSGNSNIFKRNGADENKLYYYDPKDGWQSMSVEEYRANSDEWSFNLADPSDYGTAAGQVYRVQATTRNRNAGFEPDEFLDVEGKKPIMTGSYSGHWAPSQAQIDWWRNHLKLPPMPNSDGTKSALNWWNNQALKMI